MTQPCVNEERIKNVEHEERTTNQRLFDVGMSIEKLRGSIDLLVQRTDNHSKELKAAIKRSEDHIYEGEREGGVRDRLSKLETDYEKFKSLVKQGYWKACIVTAVVGGLIARSAPDALGAVVNTLIKVLT